jgi:hypothetical protein
MHKSGGGGSGNSSSSPATLRAYWLSRRPARLDSHASAHTATYFHGEQRMKAFLLHMAVALPFRLLHIVVQDIVVSADFHNIYGGH